MKTKLTLLFLLLIVFSNCKRDKKKIDTNNKEVIYIITQGKHCFEELIENPVKKDNATVVETNKLVINFVVENNAVNGNFDYIPFGEDANKGKFTGVLEGNVVIAICTFIQNKTTKKEEVVFKIGKNNIAILGGEKQIINEVWKFKDISKGFYMNEMPRIDCK